MDKKLNLMFAATAAGYLLAWSPFASLCVWEMATQPQVFLWYSSELFLTYNNRKSQLDSVWQLHCSVRRQLPTTRSSTSTCQKVSGQTQSIYCKGLCYTLLDTLMSGSVFLGCQCQIFLSRKRILIQLLYLKVSFCEILFFFVFGLIFLLNSNLKQF